MDYASLINCNQFVAGPARAIARNLDSDAIVGGCVHIAWHPRLATAHVATADRELVCLGDAIDPRTPQADNPQVVQALLAGSNTFAEFERETATLGGRWLMIVRIGAELRLYPDATGLKSAFHTRTQDGAVWVGSQPGVLGEALGFGDDPAVRASFKAHPQNAASWPGELTPYPGVRQLLPNHFLDLRSGEVHRFWPTGDIPPRKTDEAAAEIAKLLRGSIAAVVARGSAAMALTAGYDSRTLFACAGELRRSITLFRVLGHHLPAYDTTIPRKLVRRYGLSMREVRPQPYPADAWAMLQRNVASMWWDPSDYMVATFGSLGTKYALLGWVSEVGRCFYYSDGSHPAHVTARSLAQASFYKEHPLAIEAFDRWLGDVPKSTGPALLDLFYWEHRAGNWASMMATGFDAFVEPMAPYNSRELLVTALGVNVADRRQPYHLHRQICAIAEPASVEYPFNYSLRDSVSDYVASITPWRLRAAFARLRMRAAGFDRR